MATVPASSTRRSSACVTPRARSLRLAAVGAGVLACCLAATTFFTATSRGTPLGRAGGSPVGLRAAGKPKPGAAGEEALPPALWRDPLPSVPEAALQWVQGLFSSAPDASSQRLALPEASRLLMAVGPIMGAATLVDSGVSFAGVADIIDILDAQELIREGEAALATLVQNDNFIELKLALEDGTDKIITLFKQE